MCCCPNLNFSTSKHEWGSYSFFWNISVQLLQSKCSESLTFFPVKYSYPHPNFWIQITQRKIIEIKQVLCIVSKFFLNNICYVQSEGNFEKKGPTSQVPRGNRSIFRPPSTPIVTRNKIVLVRKRRHAPSFVWRIKTWFNSMFCATVNSRGLLLI